MCRESQMCWFSSAGLYIRSYCSITSGAYLFSLTSMWIDIGRWKQWIEGGCSKVEYSLTYFYTWLDIISCHKQNNKYIYALLNRAVIEYYIIRTECLFYILRKKIFGTKASHSHWMSDVHHVRRASWIVYII